MAFDFNNVKGSAQEDLNKLITKISPVEECELELNTAKEQGNVWLMFYFYFLKELYVKANSQHYKVSTIHVNLVKKSPANTLIALKKIVDDYKKIIPNDINAIEHVIEVMKIATGAK